MIEVKVGVGDIIKIKDYASSPNYTYLVLGVDTEDIKMLRLNSFIEKPTEIEKEIFGGKQIDVSFISKKSIEKIICNIN